MSPVMTGPSFLTLLDTITAMSGGSVARARAHTAGRLRATLERSKLVTQVVDAILLLLLAHGLVLLALGVASAAAATSAVRGLEIVILFSGQIVVARRGFTRGAVGVSKDTAHMLQ